MKKDVRRNLPDIKKNPGKPENRNEAKKEEYPHRLMISTSRMGSSPLILLFLFYYLMSCNRQKDLGMGIWRNNGNTLKYRGNQ